MGCWWSGLIGLADIVAAIDRLMMPRKPDGAAGDASPRTGGSAIGGASPVWCDACHAAIVAAENDLTASTSISRTAASACGL